MRTSKKYETGLRIYRYWAEEGKDADHLWHCLHFFVSTKSIRRQDGLLLFRSVAAYHGYVAETGYFSFQIFPRGPRDNRDRLVGRSVYDSSRWFLP